MESSKSSYHHFKVLPKDRIAVLGVQGAGKSEFVRSLESDNVHVVDDALIGKDPIAGAALLHELSQDSRAVVAVLPSIAWAKRFANRVVGIQKGKVVVDSPVEALGGETFRKIYVGAPVATIESHDEHLLKVGVHTTAVESAMKAPAQKANSRAKIAVKKNSNVRSFSALTLLSGLSLGLLVGALLQKFLGLI